jgi:U5 small nuclear ribonucleoprotein component
MLGLMESPDLVRCVSLIGHFHHGKTILMDMLIQHTHQTRFNLFKQERFTDSRFDEQERGITIKSKPMSLVLPSLKEKSYLIHFLDTPGHVNFSDEVTAALRLSDGVVVVVDALDGVMSQTERLLRHAIQERQAITVVINKVDRLILELKIPPTEAYFKLKHTIDEINEILRTAIPDAEDLEDPNSPVFKVSPKKGNVCFASGEQGWSFSLRQFARVRIFIYLFSSLCIRYSVLICLFLNPQNKTKQNKTVKVKKKTIKGRNENYKRERNNENGSETIKE